MNLVTFSMREFYPKFEELAKFSLEIFQKHRLANGVGATQVMVQVHTEEDNWRYGIGTRENYENFPNPRIFNKIQPALSNSPIENYINWLALPVWRSRLMMIEPRTTYSIHKDHEFRLHLPLITNNQCFMLFPTEDDNAKMFHLPADGTTHWTNTRQFHSAVNFGTEPRLHLVMCIDAVF